MELLTFLAQNIAEEINGIRGRSEEIDCIIETPKRHRMFVPEEISDVINVNKCAIDLSLPVL